MSVSVIIPAYNAQETIERALLSALYQTVAPHEVIVVDDCSRDQTLAVANSLSLKHPSILVIHNDSNRGPSASRNAAIAAATGDWIAILDADDAWAPERIEVMSRAAQSHRADVVADNQLLYDAIAETVTRVGFPIERGTRSIEPIDVFEQEIKLGAEFSFGILKLMIRRDFLIRHGLKYDDELRYGEDLLFLAEILLCGARAVLIPEPLYIYTTRVGDQSGAPSPHSRSLPRFDLFGQGVEGLRRKYRNALSPNLDAAMNRMERRFQLEHHANRARAARREGGLLAYALHVLRRPVLLAQVISYRLPRRKA